MFIWLNGRQIFIKFGTNEQIIMKLSSENFTDFLSYAGLVIDYLNTITDNVNILDANDVFVFVKIMKIKIDTSKVTLADLIKKDIGLWLPMKTIIDSVISLANNKIIDVTTTKEIITPESMPFELILS